MSSAVKGSELDQRIQHWQKMLGCEKAGLNKYIVSTGVSITDPVKAEKAKDAF